MEKGDFLESLSKDASPWQSGCSSSSSTCCGSSQSALLNGIYVSSSNLLNHLNISLDILFSVVKSVKRSRRSFSALFCSHLTSMLIS